MELQQYREIKQRLHDIGYGSEYEWCMNIKLCDNSIDFFFEYTWVVVNSGMKNQIAEKIYQRIIDVVGKGEPIASVFNHQGKVAAIEHMRENHQHEFEEYKLASDPVEHLGKLGWIGNITKYHLARNLGVDTIKPDRHLVRIAKLWNTTPHYLCQRLSEATGDRIGAVDVVIWRAANLGMI